MSHFHFFLVIIFSISLSVWLIFAADLAAPRAGLNRASTRPPCTGPGDQPDDNYEIQHVHLVDKYQVAPGQWNYLFRGGDPDNSTNGQTFQKAVLLQVMRQRALQVGVKLPSADPYMVILNFLNLQPATIIGADVDLVNTEFEYFNSHPNEGEFHFWETVGTGDNATSLLEPQFNPALRPFLIKTMPEWISDGMVNQTESCQLTSTQVTGGRVMSDGRPAVIYGHCDCGCDRTGQSFGAYALRYFNWSWAQVNQWDIEIAHRPIVCECFFNLRWYCLYLEQVIGGNYSNLQCDDFVPCT